MNPEEANMQANEQTLQTEQRLGSGSMFDKIASGYDRLNRLMSLGLDKRWRRRAVQALQLPEDAMVLDLATGTGDLAIAIARQHHSAKVFGLDPSRNMLGVAQHKVSKYLDKTRTLLRTRVGLVAGDAQNIPFRSSIFDATVMAFGIRNVPNRVLALEEIARVTKRGGRVAILELGTPSSGLVGFLSALYVRTVLPTLGKLLSSGREYKYLQQSMDTFPSPETFRPMMEKAGIEVLSVKSMGLGTCHLFVGQVLTHRSDSFPAAAS